jgi:hypothetical protein
VELAGKILDISRGVAYEQARHGAIPTIRLGRRLVVPIAKLAESLGTTPDTLSQTLEALEAEDVTSGQKSHVQVD